MKYPKRSPYLIYRRYGDEYIVENWIYSEKYCMDQETVQFLKNLDGKHDPYELLPDYSREKVSQFMEELDDCDMLATEKKIMTIGPGLFKYPLIYCYPDRLQRKLAKIWNRFLILMFLPMLVIGLYLQCNEIREYIFSKSELYLGLIVGTLFGVVFHELSHTCAGLAYGAHMSEIGVGVHFFLPIGYVLMEDKNVKNGLSRIQINAAGVEMNLFLYGCFMCLERSGYFHSCVMYLCGIISLTMAIINILPLDGLDGMKILSIIFGKEDILQCAKKIAKSRRRYLNWHYFSAASIAAVTGSYGLVGFQIILPMFTIVEVISLVRLILL